MSPLAEKVYSALAGRDWLPSKSVAELLDLGDDRPLRGRHSIINQVNPELLREKRLIVVRRTGNPSGMKLTGKPSEILAAAQQLDAHVRSERSTVDALRAAAFTLAHAQYGSQTNLFEAA